MDWYKENKALQAELRREYPAVAELIAELENKLAERDAEIEEMKFAYKVARDEAAEARKQAARECYEIGIKLLQQGYITMIISKYMHEIQDKFGLEG